MITPIQKNINIDPIKVPKKTQSFQGVAKVGEEAKDAFTKTADKLKDTKFFNGIKNGFTKGFDRIKGFLKSTKDLVVKYVKEAFGFISKKIGEFKDISKNTGNKGKIVKNTVIAGTAAGSVAASGVAIHKAKNKTHKEG